MEPVELDSDRLVSMSQPTMSLEGSCASSSSESPISNHGSTGAHSTIGGIGGGYVSVSPKRKLPPPLLTHTSTGGHLPTRPNGELHNSLISSSSFEVQWNPIHPR